MVIHPGSVLGNSKTVIDVFFLYIPVEAWFRLADHSEDYG